MVQVRKMIRRGQGAGKRAAAGLMLCLWIFTLALAAWPELHEVFHADAKSPEHHCAVNDVLHGKLFFDGPVAVTVEAVPQISVEPASFVSLILPAVPYRLAPGRAPPLAFSPLA